ncbi:expressed unknown protein [Seminavis robusta]|uniref:Uncharacterized protein n=1 Tax=Seminavis robusta TaxID=568900 RepID=A0A9N8EQ47_9STRA|nr:expressed unknown protein [Seminavis robusta]|eukprot:Sro1416_g270860.1 n/a (641) ;mRNA; r:17561-19483
METVPDNEPFGSETGTGSEENSKEFDEQKPNGTPTKSPSKRLNELFLREDWRSPTKARPLVLEACHILKEWPHLARKEFDMRRHEDLLIFEEYPITVFLGAGWLDWETFDTIHKLYPECLEQWCGIDGDEGYPPWYPAFTSEGAGLSKEIMTFLFTGLRPAARISTFAIGVNFPCAVYIQHVLSKERSSSEIQTTLEIFDMLWACRTRWNTLLNAAVEANSEMFIRFILSQLPDEELSFRFDPRQYDMRAAQGLDKVLPRLKALDVPFGSIAEASVFVLRALQSTNISALTLRQDDDDMLEEASVIEPAAAALESLVSTTQSLKSLEFSVGMFDGCISLKYLDAVISGMKSNQHKCIKQLSLRGLEEISIENLEGLFLTGASKIDLGNKSVIWSCMVHDSDQRWASGSPEHSKQDLWDNMCQLETLTVEGVGFRGSSFYSFMMMIGNIPSLTELHVTQGFLCQESCKRKVTEAMVSLLEKGKLRKLKFQLHIDIPLFCRHLEENTSLVDLCLSCKDQDMHGGNMEILGCVLRDHNVTLESLAMTIKAFEYVSHSNMINYFLALNRLGRQKMRCEEMLPDSFLAIISAALSEEPAMVVPLVYGLLRQSPSKWTGLAAARCQVRGAQESGKKRKLEALQEAE